MVLIRPYRSLVLDCDGYDIDEASKLFRLRDSIFRQSELGEPSKFDITLD